MANPGKVLTRDELLKVLTDGKFTLTPRNIDVHILALRKKLGEAQSLILSVHGVGYKLEA